MQTNASMDLIDFVEQTERECAASIARIERVSQRTSRRIAYGYRKLFPLSMLTLAFVGIDEYKRRTDRYGRFTRLALAAQRRIGSEQNT
ncbi:hypothetical protein LFL96_36725 (plasmid) [Paraburkholderia sp. D15]|uniref:hypothetical protein n=1 Tax=Paraburkholderia sp. D15 TaxID=2880218 RepID=UPI00247AC704|nr:hypothetical protein [Paraburkholderia sp. D15]WGS55023.1 hypothetical protein LFL96_36725 [Paraburkholderia sp. D15]